jgi:purine-binding chemotaxis protein CheW
VPVVAFAVGKQRFVMEAAFVREVALFKECVPLPGAPEAVRGVINLRRHVVPLIDVMAALGVSCTAMPSYGRALVLEGAKGTFGLLAEGIVGMEALPEAAMQPCLPTMGASCRKYVKGIGPGPVWVLDGARWVAEYGG